MSVMETTRKLGGVREGLIMLRSQILSRSSMSISQCSLPLLVLIVRSIAYITPVGLCLG